MPKTLLVMILAVLPVNAAMAQTWSEEFLKCQNTCLQKLDLELAACARIHNTATYYYFVCRDLANARYNNCNSACFK